MLLQQGLWRRGRAPGISSLKKYIIGKRISVMAGATPLKPKRVENAKSWPFQIRLASAQSVSASIVALAWCRAAAVCPKEDPFDWLLFCLSYFVLPEPPAMSEAFLRQAVQTWSKRHAHRTRQGADQVVLGSLCAGRTWDLVQVKTPGAGDAVKRKVRVPVDV